MGWCSGRIRRRVVSVTDGPLKLTVTLIPADGEPDVLDDGQQQAFAGVSEALHGDGASVSPTFHVRDAPDGHGGGIWLVGRFAVTFLGGAAGVASVKAFGDYLTARVGRKVRLRIDANGGVEGEASSPEEVERLLKMADERRRQSSARTAFPPREAIRSPENTVSTNGEAANHHEFTNDQRIGSLDPLDEKIKQLYSMLFGRTASQEELTQALGLIVMCLSDLRSRVDLKPPI